MLTFLYESLKNAILQKDSVVIIFFSFIVGIATSFTPCIYPMIPITIVILQNKGSLARFSQILSVAGYILGIASVYAVIGFVVAHFGFVFGKWIAHPFFLILLTLFFLYLAFAMFGFYEIYTPTFLYKGVSEKKLSLTKNIFVSNFVFGAISGTFISPCLTPSLAMLLALVAKKSNPFLGFFSLFSFAIGIGTLLSFVGLFSTFLLKMPRAGYWMNYAKYLMGFAMFFLCVYFWSPYLTDVIQSVLYAMLSCFVILYFIFLMMTRRTK